MRQIEAQAFAYALESGAVSLEQVHAWADQQMVLAASPDEATVELSLAKGVPEAIGLLHVLGQGADPVSMSRRVIGHLRTAVRGQRISLRQAANVLERLARDGAAPSEHAETEMSGISDALYLAERGHYGTLSEVQSRLEAFLDQYAA